MTPIAYSKFQNLGDGDPIEAVTGEVMKMFPRKTGTSKGKRGNRNWSVESFYMDMGGKEEVKVQVWGREPLGKISGKTLKAWSNGDDPWADQIVAKVDEQYGSSISIPAGAGWSIGGQSSGSGKSPGATQEKETPVDFQKAITDIGNLYIATLDLCENMIIPQAENLGIKIENPGELRHAIFIECCKHKLVGHAPAPKRQEQEESPGNDEGEEGGGGGDNESGDVPF